MRKIRGEWIEFEDLPQKAQKFRIWNLSIMAILLIVEVCFLIHFLVTKDPNNRITATISIICFTILPYLFEVILRRRLSNLLFLFYLLYLFLSGFLGCVFNFYNIEFLALNKWYDVFIHILAGYTFCFVGLFVLSRIENYSKLNIYTIILFAFAFTLAVELVWELLEWFADSCLGQSAQGDKIEGYNAPLLTDTMIDLLCNFSGGVLFALQYYLGKKSKFSFGIDFLENEIAFKRVEVAGNNTENKPNQKFKVDSLVNEAKEENKNLSNK